MTASPRRWLLLVLLIAGCPSDPPVTDDDDFTDDDDSGDDDDDDDDDDSTAAPLSDCAPPPIDDPPADPTDCDADGTPDGDQLASGAGVDCNADGALDACQVLDDACVTLGARDFVEYDAGNLPIVLSAPHGGQLSPSDLPDRAAATGSGDLNTVELARAVDAALFARTGRHAHLIACQLHRDKLDCNRPLALAQDGHPETEAAWFEYHGYIDAAKDAVVAQYGRGLYIDLHGLAASRDKNELGYLLSKDQLYEPDARLAHPGYARRSSIRTLAAGSGGNVVEALRGPTSLGASLQAAGFDSVPSPTFPDPGFDSTGEQGNYFNGGYNTARHGSRAGGAVDALQIETVWAGVRDSAASREAFADALADALLAWLPTHLGLQVTARSLVRLGPVSGVASERGGVATLPVRRSGDLSETLVVGLVWSGAVDNVTPLPESVSFSSGDAEVLVTVGALSDEELDGPALLAVQLATGSGYNIAPAQWSGSVWIADASLVGAMMVDGPAALQEGATASLTLWRDGCGVGQDGAVTISGEASADDLTLSLATWGPEDALATLTLTGAVDGALEGVESVEIAVTLDGSPASASLRLIDGDQVSDLLAWFDGRAAEGQLRDATLEDIGAEVLPPNGDGPAVIDGGPAGPFLDFDALDDVVIVDDIDLPGAFTVAFGFRASATSPEGFRYLYGHGDINQSDHLNVYLTDAGTLRTSVRGSDDSSDFDALDVAGGFRDDTWHHVAVVVAPGSGGATAVYVDGALAASASRGGGTFDPAHPIYLGSRWDLSPGRHFDGALDEVMLVGRALTATEIALLAAPFLGP